MATMQGITGKLSGKMGSAVFRVREGQQVVAQYNPIVKNPNTEGQQAQRAKFKLMSQLAAIMSPGIGTMGVTKRAGGGKGNARNGFVQKNFALVETESANDTVTAKVDMASLQLTDSFRYLPSMNLTAVTGGIQLAMQDIPAEVTTIRTILVGYSGEVGEDSQANIQQMVDLPVSSGEVSFEYQVGGAGKYTVLAYGLIPSESAKSSIDLDNIHTPADDDYVSAVQLAAMVAEGQMAETMTIGRNVAVTA